MRRKVSINTVLEEPSYSINFTDIPAVSIITGSFSYYDFLKVPWQVQDISWAHVTMCVCVCMLQSPYLSSSRRLQYSSLICCLLSFSSWSFRWRRDGFTSTTNSGFTFFLYCSRWRRPFMCISLAFGSLNRHSHNLQLKLITLPEKIITIHVTLWN